MTRDELSALLPFHANGTLEGAERAAVDAALEIDADLRSELAALRAIRDTMQAEEAQSPGDLGLARLLREIEREAVTDMASAANDNRVPIARLRLWQAAAALVLAVGLGFNLLPDAGGPAPEMEAAMSDEPAAQGFSLASGDAADFTVIFSPDATEAEIRALLLEAGVEITGGPSALGLYGLGLLDLGTDDAARSVLAASEIVDDLQ